MLDAARHGGYAYPAINVTSSQTLNAALQGFAEAESDGIIQVSVGGSAYFSGKTVHDRVVGSLAFAAFAHEVAAQYPNITPSLISVTTTYPGADAKTVQETVIQPIEAQLNGVKRMLYISSTATDTGMATINGYSGHNPPGWFAFGWPTPQNWRDALREWRRLSGEVFFSKDPDAPWRTRLYRIP